MVTAATEHCAGLHNSPEPSKAYGYRKKQKCGFPLILSYSGGTLPENTEIHEKYEDRTVPVCASVSEINRSGSDLLYGSGACPLRRYRNALSPLFVQDKNGFSLVCGKFRIQSRLGRRNRPDRHSIKFMQTETADTRSVLFRADGNRITVKFSLNVANW